MSRIPGTRRYIPIKTKRKCSLHPLDPDCDWSTLPSQSSCEDPDAADGERRGSFTPHSKMTPSGREEIKQSESFYLI